MIRKKICMLGAYAVGKTSLVRRFVENSFSDSYVTTIGVKVFKRRIKLDGQQVTLMLWDLHGDDAFQTVQMAYLRGSSGLIFVADGTRAETVLCAREMQKRALDSLGAVPFLLLVNKADLESAWDLDADFAAELPGWTILESSAKTGAGVEAAFVELTERMLYPV